MQGIFQKENTDKALKYGIYRHLPTYEKIIRNLVSFFNKKEYTKLCASPMLLDFFRLAAYNQIRSNQGYFRVSGCTF